MFQNNYKNKLFFLNEEFVPSYLKDKYLYLSYKDLDKPKTSHISDKDL